MRRAGQRRGAGNIGAGGGGGAGEPGPSAEGLRQAVEQLLLQLGRTLLRDGGDGSPRAGLADGSLSPRLLLRQLLALVYRLLFLLLAEGRQLLPGPWCDAGARQRYQELCSLHGLLGEVVAAAAGQRSPTTTSPGAWERLQVTSAGLCRGCPELGLPVLGSWLWSDEAVPWLGRVRPSEEELLAALAPLAALARLATPPRSSEGADGSEWARVEVEQLGRLHESLLELEPEVDPAAGDFHLRSTAHHQRRAAGSYYTPPELVGCLLDVALEPLLDERLAAAATPSAREQALLGLRLCDPACGAGSFLLAAGRRIARRLAGERATGPPGPSAEEQRAALGEVAERCLFGVDLDPLAVELVKVGLWLELGRPELPLSSFDGLLRRGNALLGATPSLLAGSGLSPGSSDDADRWCASFFFPPCPTPPAAATVSGAAAPVARLAREQGFLHWHLEFPVIIREVGSANALAEEPEAGWSGGFDLVLGNPPYGRLPAAGQPERDLCLRRFGLGWDATNLSNLFFPAGLQILRPGGRLALVVPKSLSYVCGYRRTRGSLRRRARLAHLVDLGRGFTGVGLEQIIVLAVKKLPETAGATWSSRTTVTEEKCKTSVFRRRSREDVADLGEAELARWSMWPIHLDEAGKAIAEKLGAGSLPLRRLCVQQNGKAAIFRGVGFQSRTGYHVGPDTAGALPLLGGRNITSYLIWNERDEPRLHCAPDHPELIGDLRLQRQRCRRIACKNVVSSAVKIEATILGEGYLTLDTINNVRLDERHGFPAEYVLAVLNGRLSAWFLQNVLFNRSTLTMHLDEHYLGSILVPIWQGLPWQEEVATLASRLLELPARKLRKGVTDQAIVQQGLRRRIDELLEQALGLELSG